MQSCETVIQGIWEFLDGEMSTTTIVEFQKHLDLCRSCFSRMEFERALRENCRSKTHHTCPEKLKIRIRQIIELF